MLSPLPAAGHIMAFAQTLRGGGVERAMLRLATEWLAFGRRVTLVLGDASGPLRTELPAGLETVVLGSTSLFSLRALAGIVRARQPDVIFCPGNHYTGIAALTRFRIGPSCPPIVAKVSNRLARDDHSPLVAAGYRAFLALHPRFLDRVVAMTPAMRDEAIAMMRMPAARVAVIPNPPAPRNGIDDATGLPGRPFLLGVGRLVPQKRWDRLIGAMPQLADSAAPLMILGEGAARPALEAQVATLGLGDRVALPGYTADPAPALARAAAVVLTSDYEGVPGVLREALAFGSPVVATDSSVGVREIITDTSLGTIVPPNDPAALVRALDHWLDPATPRPDPVPEPGGDSALRYLDLFDEVLAERRVLV